MTEQTANVTPGGIFNAARLVTDAYEYAATFTQGPNFPATDRASASLAVWAALTGLNQDDALDLARRIAGADVK